MTATVTRTPFGTLSDGTEIEAVTLTNGPLAARILNWGATLQSLEVPDRDGKAADIVLGYGNIEDYVGKSAFFGSTVGRYANRIALGRFFVDGKPHTLARTDPPNTLHGGTRGFDKRVWAVTVPDQEAASVAFRRISPDGEEGFPGTLTIEASYTLTEDSLILSYQAITDAPTVLNITNHSYFNLHGEDCGATALDHLVQIHADQFTPVDETLIPTGALADVAGTPLDFRDLRRVRDRLRDGTFEQLVLARGYDHNMVLRGGVTETPKQAVRVEDPQTGRVLEISTTEPGVQFYSGNFLDATKVGKSRHVYRQGDGLAFETQHFPDSPNHPHFPSTRLAPGETFRSTTIWRFPTI